MKNWISALLLCALLTGCSEASPPSEEVTAPPTVLPESTVAPTELPQTIPETIPETTGQADLLSAYVDSLTLPQKVGQLFVIRPASLSEGSDEYCSVQMNTAAENTLLACPPGGIILFHENIESDSQLRSFLSSLQASSQIPLLMAVDEEGGDVARLANHGALDLPKFPSVQKLDGDADAARKMGAAIGAYLKDYGFHVDFAPVADVNTNPQNPVIGKRAFSADPQIAASCGRAMADGLNSQGIAATFKHFPGHGDTYQDSHKELAVSYKTEDEMAHCEWLPFRQANTRDLIMAGHIAVPEITGSMEPATLSHSVITDILRNKLGFKGLVITDSMEMSAITDSYSPGNAALSALKAGCDLILMPERYREAFFTVLSAVESGDYPQEKLNETVTRILKFKLDYGIINLDI